MLGVMVDAIDYGDVCERVLAAARERQPLAVSALAVHGVMTGVLDRRQRYRLNHLDVVTPDGQPVRLALNLLHRARLADQVRGTTMTLHVLAGAEREGLPVFFYGSTAATLRQLEAEVRRRFPALEIAGLEPSKFRSAEPGEQHEIADRIAASGARIAFIGLGCPRQEAFVYAFRGRLSIPLLAVGAAFDYLAGNLEDPPEALRRNGLEWAWRLKMEPRRLWRRYVLLNPAYLALLALQATRLWKPDSDGALPASGAIDV